MADVVGARAAKLAAAGVAMHQYYRTPGTFTRMGIAACGAKREEGAEFTTWSRYVTCAKCREIITARRAKARATLAAIEAGQV
jgi:hypothetical protein